MTKNFKGKPIIVKFKQPNGEEWSETHSITMLDIFKKDPTVVMIIDGTCDEIIYRRKER